MARRVLNGQISNNKWQAAHAARTEATKVRRAVESSTQFFANGGLTFGSQQWQVAYSLLSLNCLRRLRSSECDVGTIIAYETNVMFVFETIPATGVVQWFRLARN